MKKKKIKQTNFGRYKTNTDKWQNAKKINNFNKYI